MAGVHLKVVNDTIKGHTCHIFVDGMEITSATRDIQISIPLSGSVTATIELMVAKLELESDVYLALKPFILEAH